MSAVTDTVIREYQIRRIQDTTKLLQTMLKDIDVCNISGMELMLTDAVWNLDDIVKELSK